MILFRRLAPCKQVGGGYGDGGEYVELGYVRYGEDGKEIPANEEDVKAGIDAFLHPSPAFTAKYGEPGPAECTLCCRSSASANAIFVGLAIFSLSVSCLSFHSLSWFSGHMSIRCKRHT